MKNPSFLAVHPNASSCTRSARSAISTASRPAASARFAIDRAAGKLTLLNQQSSRGAGPCHLVVDKTGKTVLVANYGGGSVAALPIEADGRLGAAASFIQHEGSERQPERQKEPHAHSINVDPANRFAIAADLGLDKVLVYKLDPADQQADAQRPAVGHRSTPGSGPRHFAFHPSGKFAYVINEIACTVTAFDYDAEQGVLTELQTITHAAGRRERRSPSYSTAEVQVHPSGKFVYGSNRGHDSITVFAVDPSTGKLTFVENKPTQGKTPRSFGIDPTGSSCSPATRTRDTITVFRIDQATGKLDADGPEAGSRLAGVREVRHAVASARGHWIVGSRQATRLLGGDPQSCQTPAPADGAGRPGRRAESKPRQMPAIERGVVWTLWLTYGAFTFAGPTSRRPSTASSRLLRKADWD